MINTLSYLIVGCRLDYCNPLLYGKTQKNFIAYKSLNSLARRVCNAPYRCPSQPLHKSPNWVPDQSSNSTSTNSLLTKSDHTSSYLTCSNTSIIINLLTLSMMRSLNSSLLTVPPTKSAIAARAFRISAPTLWNSLSSVVNEASSQHQFIWLHLAPLYHHYLTLNLQRHDINPVID